MAACLSGPGRPGPMCGRTLLALLAGAAQLARGQGHLKEMFRQTDQDVIAGCYYNHSRYWTKSAQSYMVANYTLCQELCGRTAGCSYWGFSFTTHNCWLAGPEAVWTNKYSEHMITGPPVCPKVPSGCSELPDSTFPGPTALESKTAWPSHRIPSKLECWPKNLTGGWYNSCPSVKVLEDTATGWPGKCMGLKRVLVPYKETCESYCRKKVLCSVYQVLNDTLKSCYHSHMKSGYGCYQRQTDPWFKPLESKRLMHGTVRVLADTTGVQIVGLAKVFDENYFINVTRDAVPACRANCYSNIACQWWQYSRSAGCFVEDPTSEHGWVHYPMTDKYWLLNNDFAKTVIAGEYIQHLCPGFNGVPPGDYTVVHMQNYTTPAPTAIVTAAPIESTPPLLSTPGPVQVMQGTLMVRRLAFQQLTESQKEELEVRYAGAIFATCGVPSVQDLAKEPDSVSLSQALQDATSTRADFLVDLPAGTQGAVGRCLQSDAFQAAIVDNTTLALAASAGAIVGPLVVHSYLTATTPAPTTMSTTPALATVAPVTSQHGFFGVPFFVYALGGSLCALCLVGALAYWWKGNQGQKPSRRGERREQRKPLKRGVAGMQPPAEGLSAAAPPAEPLLTASPPPQPSAPQGAPALLPVPLPTVATPMPTYTPLGVQPLIQSAAASAARQISAVPTAYAVPVMTSRAVPFTSPVRTVTAASVAAPAAGAAPVKTGWLFDYLDKNADGVISRSEWGRMST